MSKKPEKSLGQIGFEAVNQRCPWDEALGRANHELAAKAVEQEVLRRHNVAGNKAVLDELSEMLDCIQTDGSLSGLDEIHPDSTLGQVLYDLMVAYEKLVEINMRPRP